MFHISSNSFFPLALSFRQNTFYSQKTEIIKNLALNSLKEFALVFLFYLITLPFLTFSPVSLILPVALLSFNNALRVREFFLIKQYHFSKSSQTQKKIKQQILSLEKFAALNFSILETYSCGALVHELGHVVFASFLFRDIHPKISLFWGGGETLLSTEKLSYLGNLLGRRLSLTLFVAAGSLFDWTFSLIHLISSYKTEKSHPRRSLYLSSFSFTSTCNLLQYSLSALSKKTRGDPGSHDFYLLWKLGRIHPLASAAFVSLTTLFLSVFLSLQNQRTEKALESKKTKPLIWKILPSRIQKTFFAPKEPILLL